MKRYLRSIGFLAIGCSLAFFAALSGETRSAGHEEVKPCSADKPLGGHIEITSDAEWNGCRGSIRTVLRFGLVNQNARYAKTAPLPGQQFQGNFIAPDVSYEMSTGGCSGTTNNGEETCNAPAGRKTGKASLDSRDGDGYLHFNPLGPEIDAVLLNKAGNEHDAHTPLECIGAHSGAKDIWQFGGGGLFSILPLVAGCSERAKAHRQIYCVQPTVCANPPDEATKRDCIVHADRYAVIPFVGEATNSWRNPETGYSDMLHSRIHWEICCGCGPTCDGLTAKWLQKYQDAQAKLRKSSVLYDRTVEVLHERIDENLKEISKHLLVEGAGEGAEMASEDEAVKKVLGKLATEIKSKGVKKAALVAEVAATLGALAELGYENKKDLDEAAQMSKEAEQAGAEGVALLDEVDRDIQADLENDKLCTDAREKALAANLLDAKAKDLIKEWEDENGRILDPDYHQPFIDFQAAMNRAKQILTSASQTRSNSIFPIRVTFPETTTSQESTMTTKQVRDFLVEIHRGEESWAKAMAILGTTLRAQESINRKLHGLW